MGVWRTSLRSTKSAIISWDGSYRRSKCLWRICVINYKIDVYCAYFTPNFSAEIMGLKHPAYLLSIGLLGIIFLRSVSFVSRSNSKTRYPYTTENRTHTKTMPSFIANFLTAEQTLFFNPALFLLSCDNCHVAHVTRSRAMFGQFRYFP